MTEKKEKPFHESILDSIVMARQLDLPQLAKIIKDTVIPENHDVIIKAWQEKIIGFGLGDDYGIPESLRTKNTIQVLKKMQKERDQVLKFDLWKDYADFLLNLENLFLAELQSKLDNQEIEHWLESMNNFVDENRNTGAWDVPELEDICFQLPGRKESVQISIPYADVKSIGLNFMIQDESHWYSLQKHTDLPTIFSPELIEIIVKWLQAGEVDLSEEAQFRFVEND